MLKTRKLSSGRALENNEKPVVPHRPNDSNGRVRTRTSLRQERLSADRRAMNKFDLNHDGQLDPTEIALYHLIDQNHDEKITEEELKEAVENLTEYEFGLDRVSMGHNSTTEQPMRDRVVQDEAKVYLTTGNTSDTRYQLVKQQAEQKIREVLHTFKYGPKETESAPTMLTAISGRMEPTLAYMEKPRHPTRQHLIQTRKKETMAEMDARYGLSSADAEKAAADRILAATKAHLDQERDIKSMSHAKTLLHGMLQAKSDAEESPRPDLVVYESSGLWEDDHKIEAEIRTRKDTHTRAPSPTYEHWLYNARVDERKILRRRCKTSLEKERRIESLHSLRNGHMENRRARKEKLLTDAQKLGVDFRHQLKADHLDEHLVDREDPNPFPLQAIEDTQIFSEPAKIEAHQEKHHKNMTGNRKMHLKTDGELVGEDDPTHFRDRELHHVHLVNLPPHLRCQIKIW